MSTDAQGDNGASLGRRNILLAGTTLAAGIGGNRINSIGAAQPAPSGRRPNILVIWSIC